MGEERNTLLRLTRKFAFLAILIVAIMVLLPKSGKSNAFPDCTLDSNGLWSCTQEQDCFHTCDVQFYNPQPPNPGSPGCADTCCVRQPNGSYDCSSCPECQYTYKDCVAGCFDSGAGGGCMRGTTTCQNEASRVYTDCITHADMYGCLTADGSVDQSCCYNEWIQDYSACCFP
jgi:hypothetical protein